MSFVFQTTGALHFVLLPNHPKNALAGAKTKMLKWIALLHASSFSQIIVPHLHPLAWHANCSHFNIPMCCSVNSKTTKRKHFECSHPDRALGSSFRPGHSGMRSSQVALVCGRRNFWKP